MASGMQPRVSYLIKRVERGLRSELEAALRPLGVSVAEYTALSALQARGGLSSAQLARRAFVSTQAMNQLVISLERNGCIERSVDPEHNKVLRASLTTYGAELVRRCDQATSHIERALLRGLSSEEATALRGMLDRCASSLRELDSAPKKASVDRVHLT